MAIARVQHTGASKTNSATWVEVAFSGNVTAGNLLVVSVSADHAYTGFTCSMSAGTATLGTITRQVAQDASGFAICSIIWTIPVTGTGSCTIRVTHSTLNTYYQLAISEYSGTSLTVETTGVATTRGLTNAPATDSVSSAGAALFYGQLETDYTDNLHTHNVGATYTNVYTENDGSNYMCGSAEDKLVTGATSSTADWTITGTAEAANGWSACVLVVKEGSAARKWLLGAH